MAKSANEKVGIDIARVVTFSRVGWKPKTLSVALIIAVATRSSVPRMIGAAIARAASFAKISRISSHTATTSRPARSVGKAL